MLLERWCLLMRARAGIASAHSRTIAEALLRRIISACADEESWWKLPLYVCGQWAPPWPRPPRDDASSCILDVGREHFDVTPLEALRGHAAEEHWAEVVVRLAPRLPIAGDSAVRIFDVLRSFCARGASTC